MRKREENQLAENSVRLQVENEQGEDLVVWYVGTLEHIDAVNRLNRLVKEMECPTVQEEDVKEGLRKLRNRKAAGPDKMKGEFYKVF